MARPSSFLFVAGLLALLSGCQGDTSTRLGLVPEGEESRVNLGPVNLGKRDPRMIDDPFLRERRPVGPDDAGWADKIALARDYAARGHDAEALEVVAAAIRAKPPEPHLGTLRALEHRLRVQRVETEWMRAEVRPRKDYAHFGERVVWDVRLENVGQEVIRVSAVGGAAALAFSLEATRRDWDIYATSLERSWTQHVLWAPPDGEPLEIPPGGSHVLEIAMEAGDLGEPLEGVREIVVGGVVRPSAMEVGGRRVVSTLQLRRGRVVALPRGYEPLLRDPLAAMAQAIDGGAPTHLLVAAEFVPRRRGPEAARLLARALAEGRPTLHRAAIGALERLRVGQQGALLRPLLAPLVEALLAGGDRQTVLMEGIAALGDTRLPPDARVWARWWERELGEDVRVPPAPTSRGPRSEGPSRTRGG